MSGAPGAAGALSGTAAPKNKTPLHISMWALIPAVFTVGPMLLWLLVFVLCPLVYVFVVSFGKRSVYGGILFQWNLLNYAKIFDPLYLKVFLVSGVIAALTTLLCILIGYPFAYIIARMPGSRKNLFVTLMMLPFWTNSLIRTYGWITLLRNGGVFNTLMQAAHLISQPVQLLYTNGAVMLGMVYTLFPYMVLPLYSSIEKLDLSLLEAAGDLGANPARSFVRVTLPLTAPGLFAGCIQVFVPTLGYFFISELMGGGKTLLVGNLIENQFLSAQNWPFGAALSIVLIAFTILLLRLYTFFGGSLENMA